jgi:hypothetical protein
VRLSVVGMLIAVRYVLPAVVVASVVLFALDPSGDTAEGAAITSTAAGADPFPDFVPSAAKPWH